MSVVTSLENMGWIEKVVEPKHWRMGKPTVRETEEQRPIGALEALAVLAQGCHTRQRLTGFAIAMLSFTCLWRVGEGAGLRRCESEAPAIWFRCNKNGDDVSQRESGP